MILVTGGTGFIGQALIRSLVEDGRQVRTLLRPAARTPHLPKGLPVEVAISSIEDERSLRAAVAGVDTIFHLVGREWQGVDSRLSEVEINGTRTLLRVAEEAGVERIVYLSHLGADRASAYPVMKIKGIVEEFIRQGNVKYTIIRTGLVYGENDHFTTGLAKLMGLYPLFFFLPDKGQTMLQPIWVDDLASALTWLLHNHDLDNQTIEVGGAEFLSIKQIVEEVMAAAGMNRMLVYMRPSYMRIVAVLLEYLFPDFPHSVYWLDYLANDHTCDIDAFTRYFGLLPARMIRNLDYLKDKNWRKLARQDLRQQREEAE